MMCGRCGDGLALVPVTEGPKKAKLCMDCTSEWQSERPDGQGTVPRLFQQFVLDAEARNAGGGGE